MASSLVTFYGNDPLGWSTKAELRESAFRACPGNTADGSEIQRSVADMVNIPLFSEFYIHPIGGCLGFLNHQQYCCILNFGLSLTNIIIWYIKRIANWVILTYPLKGTSDAMAKSHRRGKKNMDFKGTEKKQFPTITWLGIHNIFDSDSIVLPCLPQTWQVEYFARDDFLPPHP